jgi:hypothetical protein
MKIEIENHEGVVNALLARACPNQNGLICTAYPCKCQHREQNPQIAVASSNPFARRLKTPGAVLEVVR